MDFLARSRAQACLDALVELGVERSRLFVTYSGLGTQMAVHFIPRSMRPYAPMPEGDFADYAVITEGVTTESGDTVRVPLRAGAAQASAGAAR